VVVNEEAVNSDGPLMITADCREDARYLQANMTAYYPIKARPEMVAFFQHPAAGFQLWALKTSAGQALGTEGRHDRQRAHHDKRIFSGVILRQDAIARVVRGPLFIVAGRGEGDTGTTMPAPP